MHLSRRCTAALLLSLGLLAPSRAWATDFYVDPAAGSMNNDGSATKPWKTLEEVVLAGLIESQIWGKLPYADGATLVPKNAGAPVKAGDTIWLRSGYHGTVTLEGYYNAGLITIAAVPGDEPHLARISVTAGQNWALRGLSLSPSYAPTYDASKALIILASDGYLGPASDVTVDGCFAESVPDTSAWSGDDWLTRPADGITVGGRHHLITGNTFHNVRFGISVTASETTVERNTVNSFGNGDGMRGLGDDSVFQYNIVKNAHHPDPIPSNGNHDDAFQSWSLGVDPADGKKKPGFGVVKNITIRGNLFLSHEDLDPPFKSEFQGVGCFDGMYEGFVVENNVIISSTYHTRCAGCLTVLHEKNTSFPGMAILWCSPKAAPGSKVIG
jgi:parallel beta-helix repeat protein